jgi:Flp pilus assembly CpaE family ATPase
MQNLRGMIISDDRALVADLDGLLSQVTSSLFVRRVTFPDDEPQLEAMVKSYAPTIVFIDMADPRRALGLSILILRRTPSVHIVGLSSDNSKELLLAAIRTGMRDVLDCPLVLEDVHRCLRQAFSLMEDSPAGPSHRRQVISFLPAKAGSGTSTVALHTACTMARFGSARVALMDLDFDYGILDFMLKLPFDYGLNQIAEFASRMDDSIWSRFVSKYGDLDVLRAGVPQTNRPVTSRDMEHILGYARGNYDVICIDLPGASNGLSTSVLEQSDLIFLVCTPDLPSVHLVRKHMATLRAMKLDTRTRVVYNRCQASSPLSRADVEAVLDCEVYAMIDNDYHALQRALINGRPVDMETPLGRTYSSLVNKILGGDVDDRASSQRTLWAKVRGFIQSAGRKPGAGRRHGRLPALRQAPRVDQRTLAAAD